MLVSLDGYIETTNGDLSWSFPDPELHRHFNEEERKIETFLYGRRLYENMAAYWPTADENLAASGEEIEQLGLVDEYRLYVHPILLGGGKPMFPSLQVRIN